MISDRNRKENFVPVKGEQILRKIGEMEWTTWNYKGQDPDTHVNTGDFMGVKLIGTQTLEHRTDRLEEENEQLKIKINTSRKNYREPRGN